MFRYSGRELKSMSFAENYHRWILDSLRPYLGSCVVEVGAGTGSFSELILETRPATLTALEPSSNMYPTLVQRLNGSKAGAVCHALKSTLRDASARIASAGSTDSILYVNVLEHIEDDGAELAAAYDLLQPGGHVLIFVPAQRWLMSAMDRQVGHFRRYTRSELVEKCQQAGFDVRLSKNFDVLGIAPWWLKYRVMGSTQMEAGLVWLYDRGVVPIARVLERLVPPPVGKNVIVIGRK